MDYRQMTAPCGLDCFNCICYLAGDNPDLKPVIAAAFNISVEDAEKVVCRGCRNHEGEIPFLPVKCRVYPCAGGKNISFCCECEEFPCDLLHPYADKAAKVPHNTKVFNLCLIRKMGLEEWAKDKAGSVKETYFNKKWTL
jgi:hypothetical protein